MALALGLGPPSCVTAALHGAHAVFASRRLVFSSQSFGIKLPTVPQLSAALLQASRVTGCIPCPPPHKARVFPLFFFCLLVHSLHAQSSSELEALASNLDRVISRVRDYTLDTKDFFKKAPLLSRSELASSVCFRRRQGNIESKNSRY